MMVKCRREIITEKGEEKENVTVAKHVGRLPGGMEMFRLDSSYFCYDLTHSKIITRCPLHAAISYFFFWFLKK